MDNEVKDIENNVTPESVEVTKKPATKSQTDEKNAWYKKVLPMLKNYFKGLGKDIHRSIQDNPSIIWCLLLMVPGIFIGLFLESHVRASYALTEDYSFSGLMIFIMLLAGCLNIVCGFKVKSTRSLSASVLASICTAIIVVSGCFWIYCLIGCDHVWDGTHDCASDAVVSIICITISVIAPTVGAIASFFTRDKNYKKDTL